MPRLHRLQIADRRSRPASRGQALVELALILPVFLLLFAAALDLGRLFYSQITVNDAAREGALAAARTPYAYISNTACTSANKDSNRIMCRVLNEAKGGFVTVLPADVGMTCSTVTCPPATPALGDTISIKVTGHFTLLTPILGVFFGGQNVTFSSTATAQMNATPNSVPPNAPFAAFNATPTSGTAPLNVTFTDSSTGGPTNWLWNFGDGQTSTIQNPPVHTYVNPGAYTASLTVTNAGGSDSTTTTISVSSPIPAPPVASFTATPSSGAAPLTVTFADTSTGTPTTWLWNYGDGNTSNLQTPPAHTYAGIGSYTVTLTVTNAGGSNSTTRTISTVAACSAPTASFGVNPLSGKKKQASFVVTDSSTNMSTAGCNNTWSWNFGDGSGNSSLQAPPGHVYQNASVYTIQLTVANTAGTSTTSHAVTVTP